MNIFSAHALFATSRQTSVITHTYLPDKCNQVKRGEDRAQPVGIVQHCHLADRGEIACQFIGWALCRHFRHMTFPREDDLARAVLLLC